MMCQYEILVKMFLKWLVIIKIKNHKIHDEHFLLKWNFNFSHSNNFTYKKWKVTFNISLIKLIKIEIWILLKKEKNLWNFFFCSLKKTRSHLTDILSMLCLYAYGEHMRIFSMKYPVTSFNYNLKYPSLTKMWITSFKMFLNDFFFQNRKLW